MTNQFIDARGAYKTESLFKETIRATTAETYDPIYSLKEEDNDLPSIYKIFMSSVDEYDAAMKIVGSMAHWEKLCALKWFRNGRPDVGFRGLDAWREDMRQRDESQAKAKIMAACEEGDLNAAKKLFDISVKGSKRKVGRPNKEKVEHKDDYDYSADVVRLGLSD